MLGVEPAPGVSAGDLEGRLNAVHPDADALTRSRAAEEAPGVAEVRRSFDMVFLLYASVVPLVTGLFFLIVTLQKAGALTLLRAIGATPGLLVSSLLIQAVSVTEVGGIGVTLLGARVPGAGPRDLADVAVFGYESAPRGVPAPPGPGEGFADELLRGEGVDRGTTILVGPARSPITIVGFVDDTNYLGQASVWVESGTWHQIQAANRPDNRLALDTVQALVVVAVIVVALFFALLTVERTALYGVLKAMGARTSTLVWGLVIQSIVVTAVASVLGGGLATLLDQVIPAGAIPYDLSTSRVVTTIGLLILAAIGGSAFSLRRVLRIDPATAIGRVT